jgi:20S proteasome alpha/beta subunit
LDFHREGIEESMISAKPLPAVPRALPVPKPKRPPKRNVAMTLVAAFRGPGGGVLLCADREENDGYSKREVDKIYRISMIQCQIFMAASGPSVAISKTNMEIHNAIQQKFADGGDILLKYRSLIEGVLHTVHAQFEDLLKEYPMNLLIVIAPNFPNTSPVLYRTDGAVMLPEDHYAAYGSGKTIADYLADRLYKYGHLDRACTLGLAAFIFREAQRTASGVGLGADMVFIT